MMLAVMKSRKLPMRRRASDASEFREAALIAATDLLFHSRLDRTRRGDHAILRNLLKELIWCYSGTHDDSGKHEGCPKWSERALALYDSAPGAWKGQVELEHVYERKDIIDELLAEAKLEEDVRVIMDRQSTCVVLKEEHALLGPGKGWDRYKGMNVVDGPKTRARLLAGKPDTTA